ncbi:ComEC/Rec2 family competence protein [Patescibacteria group bacterium]|nr:ComEC/Rec2 family competence protein [Patescibacteria group bacterium]MBU1472389.1 ComEC/Rec2 family competence protein [Patescibacteria group bacterium]MBU2459872.1 ComEC/Rec2 family competence protein [Patescibacteria group bacterium]
MNVNDLTAINNQFLHEPYAGLLNGLLFGTKAALSRDFTDALIRSGTLHIIALSGINITILAGLVNLSLLWIIPRRLASIVTIAVIVWFVWFVGPSASIVRAAIMGTISLIAVVFGRQAWGLLSLVLAVGVMLLLNPVWISDLSFQLSTLATLGLILFGGNTHTTKSSAKGAFQSFVPKPHYLSKQRGIISEAINKLAELVKNDVRLTLAAQIFTIPLVFFHFHRISLVSPLSNILIGWVIPLVTILGWATVFAGWLFPPLGLALAWITWVPLQYVVMVVYATSRIPLSSVTFGWQ